MLFRDLGLAEPLLRALDEEGFAEPTPIQAGCIPLLTAGRDLVGIAQTGTGKTAAFVLPLLQRALAIQGRPARKTCRALILAPTRELAGQIIEALRLHLGDELFLRLPGAAVGLGPAGPALETPGKAMQQRMLER
ncbi:MAG: DEAD/DEAH box helicase, partial [Rhodospirillales bacterium]